MIFIERAVIRFVSELKAALLFPIILLHVWGVVRMSGHMSCKNVQETGISPNQWFPGGSSCRVKNNRKGRKKTVFKLHQMIIILTDMCSTS